MVHTETEDVLRFVKLSENAYAPTKGSPDAAGFDLYSAYDYEIAPSSKQLILTDIQIAVPNGTYGRVAPRSGLAHKNFIDVGAGVIDRDYRGNVGVILFNFNNIKFKGIILLDFCFWRPKTTICLLFLPAGGKRPNFTPGE